MASEKSASWALPSYVREVLTLILIWLTFAELLDASTSACEREDPSERGDMITACRRGCFFTECSAAPSAGRSSQRVPRSSNRCYCDRPTASSRRRGLKAHEHPLAV